MNLPATIKITDFFGIELKLYAIHFIGTVQIAIWAAGPLSGHGFRLDSERSPSAHIPHLRLKVARSNNKTLEETALPEPVIIDGEFSSRTLGAVSSSEAAR